MMGSEWRKGLLGDFVTLQRGFDLPSRDRGDGNVPIVSSSGISDTHSEARVKAPGVVTGRYGTIGQVFYVTQDFWPLNTTLYVKDFKGNDPRYIYYLLHTVDYLCCSDKSGVPGVNRNDLHTLPASVPSLPEQRAIAHILGTLDDKIELNRRMNETLEAMARAIFKSWFVDFDPVRAKAEGRDAGLPKHIADLFPDSFEDSELGEIPKGWKTQPFAETVDILGGGTPKTSVPEYWNGDIPWFSVVDAPSASDVWVLDTQKHITHEGVSKSSTQVLPIGTTIISARGTVGRTALVGVPMAMNQSCYGLRGKDETNGAFTYFATCQLVASLQQHAHGSVFDTITRGTLESILVAQPSVDLLHQFNFNVAPILEQMCSALKESRALVSLRDALLPKLISGALRVEEADEKMVGVAV